MGRGNSIQQMFHHKPSEAGNYTVFVSCCGSQVVNDKGEINHPNLGGWVPLGQEGVDKFHKRIYGNKIHERFSVLDYQSISKDYDRVNRPGVTLVQGGANKALDLLYTDPAMRKLGDGYEIQDPEDGLVSIVWVNQ